MPFLALGRGRACTARCVAPKSMVRAAAFVNRKATRSKEKNVLLLFDGISEWSLVWQMSDRPGNFVT